MVVGIVFIVTYIGYLSHGRLGGDGCSLCNFGVFFEESKIFWIHEVEQSQENIYGMGSLRM